MFHFFYKALIFNFLYFSTQLVCEISIYFKSHDLLFLLKKNNFEHEIKWHPCKLQKREVHFRCINMLTYQHLSCIKHVKPFFKSYVFAKIFLTLGPYVIYMVLAFKSLYIHLH